MKSLYKSGLVLLCVALATGAAGALEPALKPDLEPLEFNNTTTADPLPSGRLKINCTNGVRPIAATLILKNSKGEQVFLPAIPGGAIPEGGSVIDIPPGFYELKFSAGPRYIPWHNTIKLSAGETLTMPILLKPFFPLWERGWLAIDPYVAPRPGGDSVLPFEIILLQARSRGVRGIGIDFPGISFQGATNIQQLKGQAVVAAARSPEWGYSLWPSPGVFISNKALALQKNEAYPFDQNIEYHKANNAFTVWQHEAGGADLVFATVAGPLYDAIDVSDHDYSLKLWGFLLGQGYHVLAIAGGPEVAEAAEADGDVEDPDGEDPAGEDPAEADLGRFAQVSGYVPLTDPPGSKTLLQEIRDGNLTASNGPFVSFQIDSVTPGTTLPTSRAMRQITIEAFASADTDDNIGSLELLYNGSVLRQYPGGKNQRSQEIKDEAAFSKPGWVAVYCRSMSKKHFSIANPIWFSDHNSELPKPVITTLRLRILSEDKSPLYLVDIWNAGAFLGRYQVGERGLDLELPPTARFVIMNSEGEKIAEYTIYKASGAAEFTRGLRANPAGLRKALLDKKTYNRMREILDEVLIPISPKAAALPE